MEKKYLQFGTMFQQLFEPKKYDLNMIAFFLNSTR